MVLESLSDVKNLFCVLRTFSSSMYLVDSNCGLILYDDLQDINPEGLFQSSPEGRFEYQFLFGPGTTLSISADDSAICSITRIPLVVADRACLLVLIRRTFRPEEKAEKENAAYQETAYTDFLTHLYNRRYIDLRLPADLQGCFEQEQPLSILFIDIDYFKKINDHNGHVAGDCVLHGIAVLLQKLVPAQSGWVARYGGDEFLICLPGWESDSAKQIACRIRDSIRGHVFRTTYGEIAITCSIGVETVTPDHASKNVAELIYLADKKLYQAKNAGRDQVV
ncbi:GGDEF domain-containing protein [Faecalispora anaeroviscerum]|uniref:GGDEF domain-containing protein n=1 Tax=Faecalispora anaeroviscerum TaxID=2991836 RepID=UPI0024BBE9BA|nr:GGDEF domain-containing protein [Faecalispora anaeroviscerum]